MFICLEYEPHIKDKMDQIVRFFKKHGGYGRMQDMKVAKIHTRDIAKAVSNNLIEKIKPGLYKLIDYPWNENSSLIDICHANKATVICLSSALRYYNLTTFNPSEVTVAVPHNTDRFKIKYPPIRVFYFPNAFYSPGIEKIQIKSGTIRVYNKEKTVCDMFRYRNKLGIDIALEGLKSYLKLKEANINKLSKYAEVCQVKTVMMPYVKAIVG
ncbi:MAG: Abortive infection protein AbiEi [Chlorobiaceae bacterium]|nr:Abortive infection protein AbiEi [Chlorobiaceae bacterium]